MGAPHKRAFWITAAAITLATAGSGIAYATVPDSGNVIHACYLNRVGVLRVIDPAAGQQCAKLETALDWNQQGLKGDTGAQGPAGADGKDGAPGPPGPKGDPGSALAYTHVVRGPDLHDSFGNPIQATAALDGSRTKGVDGVQTVRDPSSRAYTYCFALSSTPHNIIVTPASPLNLQDGYPVATLDASGCPVGYQSAAVTVGGNFLDLWVLFN